MKERKKKTDYSTTWAVFVLLLVLIVFVFSLTNFSRRDEPIAYSTLLKEIQHTPDQPSTIERVTITNGDNIIHVKYKGDQKERFVIVPAEDKVGLIKRIDESGISLLMKDVDKSAMWFGMLSSFFLPILVIVGLLFMFRSARTTGAPDFGTAILVETERIQELEERIAQLEQELAGLRNKQDPPA